MNKIIHWVVAFIVFAVPLILMSHSPYLDISIGAILNGLYLWASHYINPTAPVNS